jgi:hypothetical protein
VTGISKIPRHFQPRTIPDLSGIVATSVTAVEDILVCSSLTALLQAGNAFAVGKKGINEIRVEFPREFNLTSD